MSSLRLMALRLVTLDRHCARARGSGRARMHGRIGCEELPMAALEHFDTHEVTNQSPPYVDVDLYASDQPLKDAVAANGGGAEAQALSAFGRHWGTAAMFDLAREANENLPKLKTFDAKGFRRDVV